MRELRDDEIVECWYDIATRGSWDMASLEAFFRFTAVWIAFNAIYSERYPKRSVGGSERNQVKAFAKDSNAKHRQLFSEDQKYCEAVGYIKKDGVVNLVSSAREEIKDAENAEEVLSCIYTIRCNFIHGEKSPGQIRDRKLVESGHYVIAALLSEPNIRKLPGV